MMADGRRLRADGRGEKADGRGLRADGRWLREEGRISKAPNLFDVFCFMSPLLHSNNLHGVLRPFQ